MTKASATAIVAGLTLAACDREPPPQPPREAPAPVQNATPAVTPAMLGRADILSALAAAASAFAAGASPGEAAAIDGRTFSIRLAFGCAGPQDGETAGDGRASWRWDEAERDQTLTLRPADWTRSERLSAGEEEPAWERVDGYWIERPWLLTDGCPAPEATPAPPGSAEPPSAGLAVIRTAEASRLGRRDGEPYRFVVRGLEEAPAPAPVQGYRVVLEGRIGAFPDGQSVRCSTNGPDRRPLCVAAVALDRVAFEAADGRQLSEWRPEA